MLNATYNCVIVGGSNRGVVVQYFYKKRRCISMKNFLLNMLDKDVGQIDIDFVSPDVNPVSAELVNPIGATVVALIVIGCLILAAAFIYLIFLLIKASRIYIKSSEVRAQKAQVRKSLGETIKEHREKCNMTQEFVAEAIGVSRQAVSKWETGSSDPSTANLLALAKLFGVSAEELLKNVTNIS